MTGKELILIKLFNDRIILMGIEVAGSQADPFLLDNHRFNIFDMPISGISEGQTQTKKYDHQQYENFHTRSNSSAVKIFHSVFHDVDDFVVLSNKRTKIRLLRCRDFLDLSQEKA